MTDMVLCCKVCGETANIRRCSKCQQVFYCSQEHQKFDWRQHKRICHPPGHNTASASAVGTHQSTSQVKRPDSALPEHGTSESEILSVRAEPLTAELSSTNENLDFREELIDEKDKKFLPSNTMLVGGSDSRLNVNFRWLISLSLTFYHSQLSLPQNKKPTHLALKLLRAPISQHPISLPSQTIIRGAAATGGVLHESHKGHECVRGMRDG